MDGSHPRYEASGPGTQKVDSVRIQPLNERIRRPESRPRDEQKEQPGLQAIEAEEEGHRHRAAILSDAEKETRLPRRGGAFSNSPFAPFQSGRRIFVERLEEESLDDEEDDEDADDLEDDRDGDRCTLEPLLGDEDCGRLARGVGDVDRGVETVPRDRVGDGVLRTLGWRRESDPPRMLSITRRGVWSLPPDARGVTAGRDGESTDPRVTGRRQFCCGARSETVGLSTDGRSITGLRGSAGAGEVARGLSTSVLGTAGVAPRPGRTTAGDLVTPERELPSLPDVEPGR